MKILNEKFRALNSTTIENFLKVVPGVFNEDPKENKNLKITCIYARSRVKYKKKHTGN